MTRLQVVLTDDQDRQLAKLARKRQISKARLAREGIELVLRQEGDQATAPLLDLIGQAGRIGRRDVSRRYDAYLAAAERTGNR